MPIPRRLFFLGSALVTVAADLSTKRFFFQEPPLYLPPWGGIFSLVQHKNMGAVFNLPVPLPALLAFSGLFVFVLLGFILPRLGSLRARFVVFSGIMLGGALGNLYDRLTLGYVRDWMLLLGRSAFNLADAAIIVGCLGMAFLDQNAPGQIQASVERDVP